MHLPYPMATRIVAVPEDRRLFLLFPPEDSVPAARGEARIFCKTRTRKAVRDERKEVSRW